MGLAKMFGWDGVNDFIDPRRNMLLGASAGFLSGDLGNVPLYAMQGKQADDAYAQAEAEKAQRQQTINQTAQWARSQFPDLANAPDEVVAKIAPELWAKQFGGEGFTLGEGQTRYNAAGKPIASGPEKATDTLARDKEAFDRESALFKEYQANEAVKTYQGVRNGYERVRASAKADSGPGDVSMIFAYMKMLDPTSVVREGEFATAENAGGVAPQLLNIYNRLLTGERLTPELRKQFLAAADQLYAETSANLQTLNEQMNSRSTGWGVDPTRILMQPEVYQPMSSSKYPNVTITPLP